MKMNQQNERLSTELHPQTGEEKNVAPAKLTRRKFLLTAGVSTLPVMMSVKSGDAWGCIGLDCTSGTVNLSGTRSAVLSAKANQQQNYIIAKWDKISNIQQIVTVDFGRDENEKNSPGFLLKHYNSACYKNKKNTSILIKDKFKTESEWYNKANFYLSQNKLYIENRLFSETTVQNRIYGLIRPAAYNNIIITSQTNMGKFFSEMNGITVGNALQSSNDFVKYVTAAFIGSVWESHSIWQTGYPGSVVNTRCYPKPDELIAAYHNVITRNAREHPQGLAGAIYDMGQLFKLYTKV
jgi:hypothetical protein